MSTLTSPESLRATRLAHGLSLREFAERIPVSAATASRWETGRRRPHSADARRIADTLGLDLRQVASWFSTQPLLRTEAFQSPANLRHLRERRGLSRTDLAAQLGVSPPTVAHWECGRRSLPVSRVHELAAALGAPAARLAEMLDSPPPPPRRPQPALTAFRRRLGLTQAQVARRIGVSTGTVSAWERGVRTPAWPQIRALTDAYCCRISDVVGAVGAALPPRSAADRQPQNGLAVAITGGRQWRGTSLRDTAGKLSINWQTLRRWERGETLPPPRQLPHLERVLGIQHGTLVTLAMSGARASHQSMKEAPA